MNKCFSCECLIENSGESTFECIINCIECENSDMKSNEEPCNDCGFNNKCKYKKKE